VGDVREVVVVFWGWLRTSLHDVYHSWVMYTALRRCLMPDGQTEGDGAQPKKAMHIEIQCPLPCAAVHVQPGPSPPQHSGLAP
jgi:hypothetical protein